MKCIWLILPETFIVTAEDKNHGDGLMCLIFILVYDKRLYLIYVKQANMKKNRSHTFYPQACSVIILLLQLIQYYLALRGIAIVIEVLQNT